MQADNFLEFFSFSGMPVFKAAIMAHKTKGENSPNAPNSVFDLRHKSFICTKFQAYATFNAIFTYICSTSRFGTKIVAILKKLDTSSCSSLGQKFYYQSLKSLDSFLERSYDLCGKHLNHNSSWHLCQIDNKRTCERAIFTHCVHFTRLLSGASVFENQRIFRWME